MTSLEWKKLENVDNSVLPSLAVELGIIVLKRFLIAFCPFSKSNSEVWLFDLEKRKWNKIITAGFSKLQSIEGHGACLYKENEVVLFGGCRGDITTTTPNKLFNTQESKDFKEGKPTSSIFSLSPNVQLTKGTNENSKNNELSSRDLTSENKGTDRSSLFETRINNESITSLQPQNIPSGSNKQDQDNSAATNLFTALLTKEGAIKFETTEGNTKPTLAFPQTGDSLFGKSLKDVSSAKTRSLFNQNPKSNSETVSTLFTLPKIEAVKEPQPCLEKLVIKNSKTLEMSWEQIELKSTAPFCSFHTANSFNNKMYVFGGKNADDKIHGDFWILDFGFHSLLNIFNLV